MIMLNYFKFRRRGVATIIGTSFFLLIVLTGYLYYNLQFRAVNDYNRVIQQMQELDQRSASENIEFVSVSFTSSNLLNITIKNVGSYQTHLIWLGIFDETANTQNYYKIDYYVDPAETKTNIGNNSIPTFGGQQRILKLITELGNTFNYDYPETSEGGGEERYDWVDQISDIYTPSAKGTHSFFAAQQGFPDGIIDNLSEANSAGTSTNNKTADADLDRNDWITGQASAGDVNSGVLSDTNLSDNTRYELIETKATGGASGNRNYLLAWRFDFTSLSDSRNDTHVYIEAQTTGETFRVYWSSDDATMNYLGNITSVSDSWIDWDIPDDSSTTIYILLKDVDNERADGTDTATADLIRIDSLFLETTTIEAVNYELDLEVQWTKVDYNEANEWLCIYVEAIAVENILVDVWNGSAWINIFAVLSSGWNNVNIAPYLNSPTLTIRFRGAIETGDPDQDSWEIDSTFLHLWT